MFARLRALSTSHGRLEVPSGAIALVIATLCLLGVIAFHFPAYLTTPQLRQIYDVQLLRDLLFWSLLAAGAISTLNMVFNRARWLSGAAFLLVIASLLLGGPTVEVDPNFPKHTPYVGLDWLTLDLLGSALAFIFVEKLVPLRRTQPVFRQQWQTDLAYFTINHLLVGFLLLATNQLAQPLISWIPTFGLQRWVRNLPYIPALLLLILLVDLVQYWLHRMYHTVPFLWRIHAVHHSAKEMDWLAGSRMHIVEVLITRTLLLVPILLLQFEKSVVDAYIVIVGVQAVFNHANVNVRVGPLRHIIVTPNFHHWHHSQDREALDRNYAAHFAFLDHLFKTVAQSQRAWPANYGVLGDYVPNGYIKQALFPFSLKRLRHGIRRKA